jgi:hypothetical protein
MEQLIARHFIPPKYEEKVLNGQKTLESKEDDDKTFAAREEKVTQKIAELAVAKRC